MKAATTSRRSSSSRQRLFRAVSTAIASVSMFAAQSAQAATLTYDATPGTAGVQAGAGAWDTTTTDWQNAVPANVAWVQGSDALFNVAGTDTLTLGATQIQVNSITNLTSALAVTIGNATGNGSISLGNASTPNTSIKTGNSATLTINSNVQLAGSQTWDNGGNGTLTVNGNITDAGTSTLTISTVSGENNKTITLTGTNSFAALTLSPVGTNQIVNQNAGSLTLSGALTSGSANSTFNSSTNNSFGSLVVNSGTVNLSGTNTITSGTTLTGGTLSITTDANFGGTGSALNFNGGTLQVNGTTLTSFGARAVTISAAKTANLNVVSAANTFNLNTNIAATTGGIAKTGLGNLTISGNNAYTGATSATDGTLTLDYSTNNGTKIGNSGGTGALSLNGATLSSTGTQAAPEVIKGLVIGAGSSTLGANPVRSTIGGNSANTFDFSSGTFTRTNGGVIAFATSGGPTVKLAGTVGTIVGAGFATIGDNYVSVDASQIVTAFTAYDNDTFTAGQNSNVTQTGDTWAGTSINTLHIGASGATTTTLTGANTLATGGILVSSVVGSNLTTLTGSGTITTGTNTDFVATLNNSGTLQIDNALTINGTGQLVVSGTGGGNLKLTAANTFANTVNIYNGTIEFANGSGTTQNLNGAVVGAGGIIKSGLGVLTMNSGSSTYAGPTVIKNGDLQLNQNTATFGNGTGLVTLGDSTAANNTVFNFSQNGRTFTNAFATAGTGGTNTIQVQGGGQNFVFSGGFTLGNNLTLSSFGGSDTITVSTGAIGGTGDLVTNITTISAGGTSNPAGTVGTSGGNITISSGVNNTGTITNNGNGTGTTTISGVIGTNVKGVVQNSATSPLTLSTANLFTNNGTTTFGLTVKSGTVNANNATALGAGAVQLGDTTGTATAIILGNGNTVANNITVQANAGANTNTLGNSGNASQVFSGLITLNDDLTVASGGTGTVNLSAAAGTAALTGSGAVTITSAAAAATNVTISGANTGFSGAVKIGSGSLKLGGATSLNAANVVSIASGTGNVLDMNGNSETIAGLDDITGFTGGSVVNTGTAGKTLTLGGSGTYTFSGVYSGGILPATAGTGTLTKSGGGTQTLNGVNIYTGATTITGGKLVIGDATHNTASLASGSAVTVSGTGVLGGSGTVNGTVAINSGGSIAPGNSPGTLNTGATSYNSGGTYQWEINNATGTKGADPGYDFNNITGALNIGATSASTFTIDVRGLNPSTNAAGAVANFNNTGYGQFTLATASGGITNFASNDFSVATTNFTSNNSLGQGAFSVQKSGNNLLLVFNPAGGGSGTNGLVQGLGIIASDNASQSAYTGGNLNGQNGGFGYGAWSTSPTTNDSAHGQFIGDAKNNAAGGSGGTNGSSYSGNFINTTGSKSFGFYANNNNTSEGTRVITGGLTAGRTFAFDFDNGYADGTSSLGFSLKNSGGTVGFEFYYSASDGKYHITDSAGQTLTQGFTGDGIHTEFTQTGTNTYSFTVSGPTFTTQTFTGTLANSVTSIASFRPFDYNQFGIDTASDYNSFFNSPIVELPTFNGQAGATGNFSTASNWAAHTPVNGGSIAFDGGTGAITANNDALSIVNNIAFNANGTPNSGNTTTNATTYTLTGNALTINGGIDNNSSSLQTINNNLTLGASQSFNATNGGITLGGTVALGGKILTVNAANPVISSGIISGNGDIIKSGSGTLTLSGANTFTGDNTNNRGQVFITDGTLRVGNASALGTQTGGTSVDLGDSNPIVGSITHNSNNVSLLANSGLTIANQIYVDTNTGGSTRTIGSDGTTGAVTFTGNVLLTGSAILTAASGGDVTFSGTVGPATFTAGGITKTGAGKVTLSGVDGYTGTTTVSNGTLAIDSGASGTGRLAGTSGITVNTGGTLLLAQSGTASTDRINNAATLTLAGGTFNLGDKSEGAAGTVGLGSLTLSASSTLDFGSNTAQGNVIEFAAGVTHTAGTLAITDWNGTLFTGNGSERLLFAGTLGAAGSFDQQFAQNAVSFNGVQGYSAVQFGTGAGAYYEITAVPEPTTWFAAFGLLGLVGYRERKRLSTLFSKAA